MNRTAYSLADIEGLTTLFEHPVAVILDGNMCAVNPAFLGLVERPGAEVLGRSFGDFLAPEERSRLVERSKLPQRATSTRYPLIILAASGRRIPSLTQVQHLPSGRRNPYVVCQIFPVDTPTEPALLSQQLVQLATHVVSERTDATVRAATLEGLAALGFQAAFFRLASDRLVPLDAATRITLREDLALEALREQRPIFAGTEELPEAAYLPINVGPEVLALRSSVGAAPRLVGQHSVVLTLFAKQVSSALGNARFVADFQRRTDELEAIAEVARLAAQPFLVPLNEFLEKIARPFDADAVALHTVESGRQVLRLTADHGLDSESRTAMAAGDPTTFAARATLVEGGVTFNPGDGTPTPSGTGSYLSGAAVRLAQGGQLLGTLQVLRRGNRPYNVDALQLLGTLGDLMVAVLEQRRLHEESRRQLRETQLLLELARTTSGTLEMSSILDVACDFLSKLLDTTNCFILLYDPEARVLRGAASSSGHREFFRTVVIPLSDESVAARTARERRPVAVEDVRISEGAFHRDLVDRFRETAVLGLPLTSRDELIGVVILDDTRGPRHFSQQLVELAQATVGQLALSIANARLYESLWQSYAELAATRAEMVKRERLAALGELSAIVAHEVRNPLGVIFNAVSSLRRLLRPTGDAEMLLDILREESDRLNRMVGDLLDFARPREISSQPEDFAEVLQESIAAALSQPGIEADAVRFQSDIEPNLPNVQLDRRLFRQALVNVAVNAIQAMPRGGTIWVRATREQRDGRSLLRIELADQGMGIPQEISHRIFEPFFTTKAKGTGLGLAVVKRILDDHDGEVAVSSTLGQGTTFTFRLPLSRGGATTSP